ncbi:AhpD family alkylhydroperoxidase [Bradyrhizobium sp. USDA 223]
MKPRMNYYQAAPDTIKALMALEQQIQSTGLEKSLIELVKIRASQINGCAFCINMHTEDARKRGETEQRIYLLNAGANPRSIPTASAPRWPGPKR